MGIGPSLVGVVYEVSTVCAEWAAKPPWKHTGKGLKSLRLSGKVTPPDPMTKRPKLVATHCPTSRELLQRTS